MTTLRDWFSRFTEETTETPTHVVLGFDEWSHQKNDLPDVESGAVVPFDELPPSVMDRRFDDGFGGNESPDLCAWSPSWVLFSDNYDGAEHLCWVPRNPTRHEPIRPGGG